MYLLYFKGSKLINYPVNIGNKFQYIGNVFNFKYLNDFLKTVEHNIKQIYYIIPFHKRKRLTAYGVAVSDSLPSNKLGKVYFLQSFSLKQFRK